ncbi:MAG TPA: hypothetical protein VL860_09470 [Planctomycetota bacterium]|nr:hypothetical protein [Planctomycetota bacterium]
MTIPAGLRKVRSAAWLLSAGFALLGGFELLTAADGDNPPVDPPAPAEAEEPKPLSITEKDFTTYWKLRIAIHVHDDRKFKTRDKDVLAQIEADLTQAFKDAGWDRTQYDRVRSDIENVASVVADTQRKDDPEAAAGALENLKDYNATTVATVKAHTKELNDSVGEQKQIQEIIAKAETPSPIDPAKLPGTWVMDLDASCEVVVPGAGEDFKKTFRENMAKQMKSSQYTFGPGNAIETKTVMADDKVQIEKGTFRCEGNVIFFQAEGSKREHKLTCVIKGDLLIMSMIAFRKMAAGAGAPPPAK